MKNAVKIILGLAIVAAGLFWALDILNIYTFTFSLKGWWTLFIIVPCIGGLFFERDKIGPCMGIGIGVLLLLAARDIISWHQMGQLALAVVIVCIGLKILFFKRESFEPATAFETINRDGKFIRNIDFSFGKQMLSFDGEKFEGADVKASFGTVELDLRKAEITDNTDIVVDAAFCGIVIWAPENVAVKTAVNCGFGGVSDKRRNKVESGSPVLLVKGKAGFAGIEIR